MSSIRDVEMDEHGGHPEAPALYLAAGALVVTGLALLPNVDAVARGTGGRLLLAAGGAVALLVGGVAADRVLGSARRHRQEVRFAGLLLLHGGLGLAVAGHLALRWARPAVGLVSLGLIGVGLRPVFRGARPRPMAAALVGVGGAAVYVVPGVANGVAHFAATRIWELGRPDTPATARAYLLAAPLAGVWAAVVASGLERGSSVGRAPPAPSRRSTSALLEVAGLEVSYGAVQVLFGVSLHIQEGECVALLGTNGAGKSTLLAATFGLRAPDRGRVWLGGEDVTGRPAERLVRDGMLLVPGGRGVFPSLTVLENLRMAGYAAPDQRAAGKRAEQVVEVFPRLGELADRAAGLLSGGEQQMLALSRAWVMQPRLLAIDELTLGLAPSLVAPLLSFVGRLRDDGVAVILVEQSVNTALVVAERACFLERGEVRFEGPTRELLDRPDLVRSVFLEGATSAGALHR